MNNCCLDAMMPYDVMLHATRPIWDTATGNVELGLKFGGTCR